MKKIAFLFLIFSLLTLHSLISQTDSAIQNGPVYIIPVNEDIDPFLVVFLKRSIVKAKEAESPMIIFQLNTFGGRVDSALEITSLIGSVSWAETVAYIPSASGGTGVSWSAGALISFSCDKIVMDAGTSMGAAAPVYQSSEGMVMAEEKTVSAVRGQMAALAEKNGYPRSIALAMVDDDLELYEVETDEGVRLFTPGEIQELERVSGSTIVRGRQLSAADKLLTLTAGEMERYGVSSATVTGRDSLYDYLKITGSSVVVLEKSRSDWFVAFISSAAVTSLLVMVGLVALYLEVTSPGFGIPGTIALVCFTVVFAASTMIGNMGSLELLLFLAGVVLLLVEIFIIPGFGVTGISGIILILLSLVLSRQDFVVPEFVWQWDLFRKNLLYVSLSLVGALALIGVLMIMLPQSRLFSRLVLKSDGDGGSDDAVESAGEVKSNRLGEKGTALTDLRPVGKADFSGEILIVQTDGEYIEKGSEVIVIKKEGLRLVVRKGV
ncbi:NfeD family protein [Spirochaeta isovalerica]|uniref:Membrane-bound serine protease (ClpP class) n=1 Tax=Spirochaeta isovalerica TaxID=150 RepID=A0A841R726_9SPIO|nr:NfeD family protein [Spirochaeta isovalerica]MBB6481034.1 membrane-bound serine protease (ClpP class) [Spirochaeta isovalerica]